MFRFCLFRTKDWRSQILLLKRSTRSSTLPPSSLSWRRNLYGNCLGQSRTVTVPGNKGRTNRAAIEGVRPPIQENGFAFSFKDHSITSMLIEMRHYMNLYPIIKHLRKLPLNRTLTLLSRNLWLYIIPTRAIIQYILETLFKYTGLKLSNITREFSNQTAGF